MKFSLQKNAGLTKSDPLFHYLGKVDEFWRKHTWLDEINLRLSWQELIIMLEKTSETMEDLPKLVKKDNPVFAELIYELLKTDLPNEKICLVLTFIAANWDYYKEQEKFLFEKEIFKEGLKCRSIDAK